MVNRIVHISTVHDAYDIRIFHRECRTLAAAGFEVLFVVPHETDEVVEGVQIRALAAPRGRLARMTRTVWQAGRLAFGQNPGVVHLHDPELLPLGMALRLRGQRVIYDAHEDFPRQVLTHHWIPSPLRPVVGGLVGALGAAAARMFNGIVAATPAIASRFPAKKTVTVQNFPAVSEFDRDRLTPYAARPPQIVYLGVLATTRGVIEMVRSMALLPPSLEARMVWAGTFSPRELETEVRQMPGWERVDFLGWKGRGEIAEMLSNSRVGIAPLHPTPSYVQAWPIKMFEYMAAGLPVIVSDFPLWREIVGGAECGLLVDPQSAQALADAIYWILTHPHEAEEMGRRGREAVLHRYNWNTEGRKLLDLYQKLTLRE